MPLSTNPVVGFNFLVSVSSVTGTPITLSASNGATQNGTNGLVLSVNQAMELPEQRVSRGAMHKTTVVSILAGVVDMTTTGPLSLQHRLRCL